MFWPEGGAVTIHILIYDAQRYYKKLKFPMLAPPVQGELESNPTSELQHIIPFQGLPHYVMCSTYVL